MPWDIKRYLSMPFDGRKISFDAIRWTKDIVRYHSISTADVPISIGVKGTHVNYCAFLKKWRKISFDIKWCRFKEWTVHSLKRYLSSSKDIFRHFFKNALTQTLCFTSMLFTPCDIATSSFDIERYLSISKDIFRRTKDIFRRTKDIFRYRKVSFVTFLTFLP
jgi:hypothetical protein